VHGEVHERDTVRELERRVLEPIRLSARQLGVHVTDELLVLGDPVALDGVANQHTSHVVLLGGSR
jgi:hypothetical protein